MYNFLLLCCFVFPIFAAPKLDIEHDIKSDIELETWCEGKPADIYFLLDTSSSITHSDFAKQKAFVQDLVSVFDISESTTRVAVSTFSTYYHSIFKFGRFDDRQDVMGAIGLIRHRGGNTNTGGAIKRMVEEGFSSARRGVAHIAFVLTDGKSQLEQVTVKEAAKAKKAGIYMYAIGIGNGADDIELRAIGSEPSEKFVYSVTSFDVLYELKQDLAATACTIEAQNDQPLCGHGQITDLMYTFDASAMGAAKARKIYKFITNTSEHFSASEGNIRTGVLSRHCPHNDFELNTYDNKYELINELNTPKLHGMDHIIRELRLESFNEENGGRNAARHAAVLFVDGETEKIEKLEKQAMYAKFNDIELFVVNIGEGIDSKVLENIASQPTSAHVWNIDSCDDLDSIKMELINAIC